MYKQNFLTVTEIVNTIALRGLLVTLVGFV